MKIKIKQILAKIPQFLREVKIELKKVTWPSRRDVIRYTLIVIGVSLAVAVFLGGLDLLFSFLINRFLL